MTIDKCPDIMKVKEVADLFRLSTSTVLGLKGLKRFRIGNGRGIVRYRKEDVIEYVVDHIEELEDLSNVGDKTERHRKMGLSSLLSLKELQASCVGYQRRRPRSL